MRSILRNANYSLSYHALMVLDDLHELIETLQTRIAAHAPALQQSEALTRYALIDPLLRALGWDTAEPSQVRVELPLAKGYAQQGFADYALLGIDGKPRVVIEAKSLGTSLQQAAMQALGYCNALGFPYFAVTDGRHWELYETFQPVALPEKLVMRLDLNGPIARTCLDSLALWRSGVVAGSAKAGTAPVTEEHPQAAVSTSTPSTAPNLPNSEQWHPLTDFAPAGGTKPAEVRFPSGVTSVATSWAEAIARIGQWLYDNGHLSKAIVPIGRSQTKRLLLAEKPAHLDGAPFKGRKQVGPYYIHTGFNARDQMSNARFIIKRAGVDPAGFAVRMQ